MNQPNRTTPPIQGVNRPSDGGDQTELYNEIDSLVNRRAAALGEIPEQLDLDLVDNHPQNQPNVVRPDSQDQPFGVVGFDGQPPQSGARFQQQQPQPQQQLQNQPEPEPQPQPALNPTAELLNTMAAMMNQMQGGGNGGFQQTPQVNPQQEYQPTQVVQTPSQDFSGRYLDESEDFDATDVNKAINKALKHVEQQYGKMNQNIKQEIVQDVIKSLAPTLAKFSQDQINLNMAVSQFYNNNPDLKNYRDLVQWRTNIVHSQNPGLPVDQILNKVATEVRSYINPQQQAPNNNSGGVPAGVQTPGRQNFTRAPQSFSGGVRLPQQNQPDQQGSLQQEIDQLVYRRRR